MSLFADEPFQLPFKITFPYQLGIPPCQLAAGRQHTMRTKRRSYWRLCGEREKNRLSIVANKVAPNDCLRGYGPNNRLSLTVGVRVSEVEAALHF
jgi:hypothetical protein